jgi:hypothetical protein
VTATKPLDLACYCRRNGALTCTVDCKCACHTAHAALGQGEGR